MTGPVAGRDGDDRLAGRVAADLGQLDTGRDLAGPAGQGQPPGIAQLAQVADLAGLDGVRELPPAAHRPGPEVVLRPAS